MRVTENATVGTEVLQVRAVDGDTGSNGEVGIPACTDCCTALLSRFATG